MPILVPGQTTIESYRSFLDGKISQEQFYDMFPTKVYPVTDDSPFFLSFEKPLPIILQGLLYASFIIVAFFLLFPFAWIRKSTEGRNNTGLSSIVPYFAALGAGFILIELSLMQKLILLLGNPTTTFSILLFTLLVSSGAGSFVSSKIMKNGTRNLILVIGGVVVIGTLYAVLLQPLIYSVIAEPFEIKALIAIGVLAPIGFLMGMPMPTGMRVVKVHNPKYVPWMWAINGAFSVLGSVLSVTIAILQGASYALMLGISIYFIALGISFSWRKISISEIHPLTEEQ